MSAAGDPAEFQSLTEALKEATSVRKRVATQGVARRLKTAACLLEQQEASTSVALLQDTEALDSDVRPPHVQLVPERLVEVFIQLLTVVALCATAVCAGLIVGSVVSRTTLTPGTILLSLSPFQGGLYSQFLRPDTTGGAANVSSDVAAVFRAQFTVSLPLCNTGALIESLSLFAELVYVPAVGLPSTADCFSPSGPFSTLLSLFPLEQQPPPAAAASLLKRGRESASMISRLNVETDLEGDSDDEQPLVHVYLPRIDTRMQALLQYDAAAAAGSSPPAAGPTLLVSNSVPFIPGLRVGVDAVSLYVGINLPLLDGDSALRAALYEDCEKRQKVYFQLHAQTFGATSMFFRVPRQYIGYGVFAVPCQVQTVSPQAWPPETPESFVAQVEAHNMEISVLAKEDGQKA